MSWRFLSRHINWRNKSNERGFLCSYPWGKTSIYSCLHQYVSPPCRLCLMLHKASFATFHLVSVCDGEQRYLMLCSFRHFQFRRLGILNDWACYPENTSTLNRILSACFILKITRKKERKLNFRQICNQNDNFFFFGTGKALTRQSRPWTFHISTAQLLHQSMN